MMDRLHISAETLHRDLKQIISGCELDEVDQSHGLTGHQIWPR